MPPASIGLVSRVAPVVLAIGVLSAVPARAAVPGLVGTSCDAVCAAYVAQITEFENVFETITPDVVYVDSYHGDDANDGSLGSPIASFALAKWFWKQHGTRIKFRNGQVWSPLVFKPNAGVSSCIVGESVTAGAKDAEIRDVDAAAGVIVFRTLDAASGDLTTADTITGTTSGCVLNLAGTVIDTMNSRAIASGFQDTGSCTPTAGTVCDVNATFVSDGVKPDDCFWNSTHGPIAKVLYVSSETRLVLATGITGNSSGDGYTIYDRGCAGQLAEIDGAPGFDDRIVSLMEAEDPLGELPEINCNGRIGGAYATASGVFGVRGDGLGIAGVQNFSVRSCLSDVVTQHQSAKIIALRIIADDIGNDTWTRSNNCTTNHNDGMTGTIANDCRSKPFVSTSGSTIAPTGICSDNYLYGCDVQTHDEPEAFLWDIGSRFTMDLSNSLEPHSVMQSTGSNVMLIDTEMVCDSAGSSRNCNGPAPLSGNWVPTDGYDVYFARTTIDVSRPDTSSNAYCYRLDNTDIHGPMTYSLYNVTAGGEGDCNQTIQVGSGAGATEVYARNLLLQESEPCVGSSDGLLYAGAGQSPADLLDLQGVHGTDECWHFNGSDPGDTAALDAAARSMNPNSVVFQVGSTFDPDDQFGGDPFNCDPAESCFEGATSPWTIPFSSLHGTPAQPFCLKDIVDGVICDFTGGTGNAGAVPEPGAAAQLLAGIAMLGWLSRTRAWRER